MKLLIVLSLIACGYAAKLDRTYLPPSSAATAGGSPGSLNAPVGPSGSLGFGQNTANSGFGQPSGLGSPSGTGFGKSTSGPAFGALQSVSSGVGPSAKITTAGGSPGFLNAPAGPSGSPGFGRPSGSSSFGQSAEFGSPNSPSFGKSTSGPAFGAQPSGSSRFAPSAQYGQPGSPAESLDPGFSQPAQNFGQSAQNYQRNQPQRAQAAAEQGAEILRFDNQNDGETFSYSFETSNGITAEESGVATNGVQAQGAFSYSDDDGQNFRITYTADENGYQPQGEHLPTPHPIPEEILKSIEQNAQAAAAGTQEGAYNPNEDNSGSAPQQYSSNAPSSFGKAPTGSGSFNQFQGSGSGQLYGAPNAGGASNARPQFGSQGFQPQGSAQQYGAPSGGASPSVPSNSFGQSQKAPSQVYGSSSSGAAAPGANEAFQARPNSFGQNQVQSQGPSQQYGVPSRPSAPGGTNGFIPLGPASNGFTPSGSASQSKPNQYQAPSQPGFPSGGRPQGPAQTGQAQDESSYQYDRPHSSSFGQASNSRPSSQGSAGQFRPQNGATQPSNPQGSFPRPSSNNVGYPSSTAQGPSFGSSSGPNSQNPNAGAFGSSSGTKGPSSFGPSAGPAGQGSFGSSSRPQGPSSFGPSAGPAGQSSFGSSSRPQGPSSFGPSAGSNGQSSFGPSSGANAFNRPQSSFPSAGTKGSMPDSGYTYNRPGSQPGAGSTQPQGGANAPGSGAGQNFGGPRQPPSFNEQEGYKY